MKSKPLKTALTIAGSDPSGGAGIQADLRAFARMGVHGTAVISSLTIQNTQGIQEVIKIPPDLLRKQIATLLDDMPVQAVKTGILQDAETIGIVSEQIKKYSLSNYVLDPIIRSSSGFWILKKDDIELLKKYLFPSAFLVTPNLGEAEALTGISIRTEKDILRAANEIRGMGARYVLVKGGHADGPAMDILVGPSLVRRFSKPRVRDVRLHGAGCVLSAAITAGLAQGLGPEAAVRRAKNFVHQAIRTSAAVGRGRRVLNLSGK
ncbi:MAG TPA: bifunctional hydroxymethylpyrimidine kinase/phosphomethylpyrimidine kinase [Nitrospiria bacterium]